MIKCLKEYIKKYDFSNKVANFFLSKHTRRLYNGKACACSNKKAR